MTVACFENQHIFLLLDMTQISFPGTKTTHHYSEVLYLIDWYSRNPLWAFSFLPFSLMASHKSQVCDFLKKIIDCMNCIGISFARGLNGLCIQTQKLVCESGRAGPNAPVRQVGRCTIYYRKNLHLSFDEPSFKMEIRLLFRSSSRPRDSGYV